MNYLATIGEGIRARIDPSLIPDGDVSLLFAIYAVLALAKGTSVTLADVHNAWVAWMSVNDPDHPALEPFDRLDPETASADEPFRTAIVLTAAELEVGGS